MIKGYDTYEKMDAEPTWRLLMEAMRNAISEDVVNLKICMFKRCNVCTKCGEVMEYEECHLDHYYPQFNEIVLTFIKSRKYEVKDIKLRQHWSSVDRWLMKFDNMYIEQDWVTYHHTMASFRLIHKKENLGRYRIMTEKWLLRYDNIEIKSDVTLNELMDIDFKVIEDDSAKRMRELDEKLEELAKTPLKKIRSDKEKVEESFVNSKVKQPKKTTGWTEHVKAYANAHKISYFQALKAAAATYVKEDE